MFRVHNTISRYFTNICVQAVHNAKDPMQKNCPLLEHFNWHRIVMDEAHEYINQEFYKGRHKIEGVS